MTQAAATIAGGLVQPVGIALKVDDGALNVAIAGSGPSVVMLHGWTLDHRMWRPQLPLAQDYRLIMPDRRGFGRSNAPADLTGEWRDLDALAGGDRFVLVGLSQGALVALDYARRRPERLSALVLAGAPLHGVVPHGNAADAFPQAHYVAMIREGSLDAMKADWRANPLVQVNDSARSLVDAMLDDYDGRDLLAEPAPLSISAEDINALPMPVLAMAGAGDTAWRREVARYIGSTATFGQFVIFNGAGHLCNLDDPARFNALLSRFLDTHLH